MRNQGGQHLWESGGDEALARQIRLQEQSYNQGTIYQNQQFSMELHASVMSTGWQRSPPPAWARNDIQRKWREGEIQEVVSTFCPVPYIANGR